MTQVDTNTPDPAAVAAAAAAAQTEILLKANPELIPKQFDGNADKALEGYKEMMGAYTKSQQENTELKAQLAVAVVVPAETSNATETTTPPVAPGVIQIQTSEKTDGPKVVDWDAIGVELRKTGDIVDETRKNLIEQGVTETTIKAFEAGQKALISQERTAAIAVVGGEENLQAMLTSFEKTKSADEIKSINEGLAGPHAEMVLSGLYQQYVAATAAEGGTVPESSTASSVATTQSNLKFTEQQQVTTAMNSAEYHRDPVKRAEIEKAVQEFYASNTEIVIRKH